MDADVLDAAESDPLTLNDAELDDEIEQFERSLNADWEVSLPEHTPKTSACVRSSASQWQVSVYHSVLPSLCLLRGLHYKCRKWGHQLFVVSQCLPSSAYLLGAYRGSE